MNASEAPVFGDPDWNRYRTRVAEVLSDVEADIQQRGYGLGLEGLTLEVAERLPLGTYFQTQPAGMLPDEGTVMLLGVDGSLGEVRPKPDRKTPVLDQLRETLQADYIDVHCP